MFLDQTARKSITGNVGNQVGRSSVYGEVIVDPVTIGVRTRGVHKIGLRWNGEEQRDHAEHYEYHQ